jgi:hypothetical protein
LSLLDLSRWIGNHEMTLFGPSWGLWSPRMDAETPRLGRLVITIFTLKKEVVSFGGTLAWLGDELPPLSTWTPAFGGLDVTHLAYDVTI